jgi:hypothetical protein
MSTARFRAVQLPGVECDPSFSRSLSQGLPGGAQGQRQTCCAFVARSGSPRRWTALLEVSVGPMRLTSATSGARLPMSEPADPRPTAARWEGCNMITRMVEPGQSPIAAECLA